MKLPKITDKKCKTENLYPGKYFYCTCGLTKDGAFCDGSHQGTEFYPKKFFIEEPRTVGLCMCRHSKNAPYCDGSHRKIKEEDE